MENETLDNPAQPETEAPEPNTEETPNESDEQPELADDADGQATEPTDEEVEYNGNRYKVPKELAEVIAKHESMQADATRKWQAAADLRKEAESYRAEVVRESEYNQQMVDDLAQARFVESRLQQLANVNPYELPPDQAQHYMMEQMQLTNAKGELAKRIEGRRTELETIQKQHDANLVSQAMQELSKPDERLGWSGTYDQTARTSLTTFGKELGFSDDELGSIRNPTAIKTLHLAKIGYETLKKQRAAVAVPKTEAKPVPQVGGAKAKVSPRPESMDFKQYKAWREKNSKVM